MIDLPMMAKILDAMPCNTKLILLGDMHQLASVDPGAVLGDICSAGEAASTTPLATAIKKLTYSHRFNINAPVGQLSMALHQAGGADDPSGDIALNILQKLSQASGSGEGVYQHAVPLSLRDSASHPIRDLRQLILENYKKFLQAVSPQQAFKALENFRVLSPLRQGPHGISTLNRLIEDILSLQNIKIAKPDFAALIPSVEFYNHRVIMITSNNYGLQLFNGDIGIVLPENADTPPLDNSTSNRNVVWFERPAATPEEASFRPVPCNMLPPHETAFAMSIHKSQGSQYKNVMVIVPAHDNKNLFTKELLYTAITRAEEKVFLWCNDDTFKAAAIRKARRTSGLVERINLKTAAQSNDICLPSAQIDLE
jgi:exodeoxyribonuclease V alpha subunit